MSIYVFPSWYLCVFFIIIAEGWREFFIYILNVIHTDFFRFSHALNSCRLKFAVTHTYKYINIYTQCTINTNRRCIGTVLCSLYNYIWIWEKSCIKPKNVYKRAYDSSKTCVWNLSPFIFLHCLTYLSIR